MNDKTSSFGDQDWHDSVILEVSIDRRDPGVVDEVVLRLRLPNSHSRIVRFTDCYGFQASMSFGVVAEEAILEARCLSDSASLAEIRQRWLGLSVDLSGLRCFEIVTSSTASVLKVYAKTVEFEDDEGS